MKLFWVVDVNKLTVNVHDKSFEENVNMKALFDIYIYFFIKWENYNN